MKNLIEEYGTFLVGSVIAVIVVTITMGVFPILRDVAEKHTNLLVDSNQEISVYYQIPNTENNI